ncbi:MAG: hypothetical protein NTW30_01585 [Candidatus Aenigmarchaeota archaeon]|nr:hypothetical protein [Candidatus Aenigmarchaeota archaeon]
MELPFNIVVALIAMMIFLLIVISFAYYTKSEGQSVLDKIWNLGDWLQEILKGNK